MNKIGLFLGTERGYEALKELLDARVNIGFVLILQQDRHEIRNFTLQIAKLCKQYRIPFNFSRRVKPKDYKNYLRQHLVDAVFMIWWRFLLPSECLTIPKRGIFVVHDTLLPKYRGMATTIWPLINGEKETGLTLMYADRETDAGDIVDQIKIPIHEKDTGRTMNDKYIKLIPKIILKNLPAILSGTNKKIPQDESKATYGCKRVPEDGKIDFNKNTKEIVRLVRALTYPYPGAFCYYKKIKVIIWEASEVKNPPAYVGRIPGRIISISKEGPVKVLSLDGIVKIEKVGFPKNPERFLDPNKIFHSVAQSLL